MTTNQLIERAFTWSVVRMQEWYDLSWVHNPNLKIVDHVDLFCSVTRTPDLVVEVSTGCVKKIEYVTKESTASFDVERALEWLILHELHHADLAHFDILDAEPTLHLVTRSKGNARSIVKIPKDLRHKVSPCLELQADHDALEMMLGDYSASDWTSVRKLATSIAAVMVLIETAGSGQGDEPHSHPLAATRIFQLLGHVAEMWSIPAHAKANARGEQTVRDEDLPHQMAVQAFSKEVILPAFWDAVALAEAADAKSIISDLGSPEDFFADIGRAKLGQWDELVTVGANEWATLKDANEAILPLLSINHAMN